MEYKVLLTTSGIGSRLGEITNFTNKSLVRVGDKPCISHILDNYPEEIEIVVTLGYYKDQVKDFLSLVYPKRKFTFVEVENFRGEGSCQGLSMLQAKEHLQCPFIFNSCDTIVESNIPEPHTNWVIGSSEESNDQYRTIDKQGNIFLSFKEKGEAPNSDKVLSYTGCEVNINTWKGLRDLTETLREYGDITKSMPIYNQDAIQCMQQYREDAFDFIFTSPPYFDAEEYDENQSQSCWKYAHYTDWFDEFLLQGDKDMVRISKLAIVNVANTGGYKIADDLRKEVSKEGLLKEEFRLRIPQFGGKFRYEPLFVLSK